MADGRKPLSELVAQGWEILHYCTTDNGGTAKVESFLLRKQKMHRILSLRPKMMGKGFEVKELDI